MATDFGTDLSHWPDLDPYGTYVSGTTALAQALQRRLSTPRGGLFYDQAYGTDLRAYLNDSITAQGQYAIQAAVESECLQDERVLSCDAVVSFNTAAQSLTVHITCSTTAGPFQLTLGISQLSVSILQVN